MPTLARFRPMIREMLLMDFNSLKVSDFLLEGGLRWDSIQIQRLSTQESGNANFSNPANNIYLIG